jgi:hypothetical protein
MRGASVQYVEWLAWKLSAGQGSPTGNFLADCADIALCIGVVFVFLVLSSFIRNPSVLDEALKFNAVGPL